VSASADATSAADSSRLRPASELAADLGMAPALPTYKEGLALINGATVSAALLALAAHDAARLADVADTAAALSLEAVCGCARAFDARVQEARGMAGQIHSAARVRAHVAGSRLVDRAGAVQDVYSLRCAPAVHGASRDAIAYAADIAEREVNAATDNPLFFPDATGQTDESASFDASFAANWPPDYRGEERASYSAGNFHGQPLALAADFLAIAVAELADISERRSQILLDAHFSRGLPANLIPYRGTQSGLMLLQYAAASLVSENKVLAHPASVDSIPTAANAEDHVSMATTAGRKLHAVLANVEATLAIELLVAAQALEWRAALLLGDCQIVHLTHERLASAAAGERAGLLAAQDEEAAIFGRFASPAGRAEVASLLGQGSAGAYHAIRAVVEPIMADRPLDGDILQLRRAIADGRLGIDTGAV
jgi:histidine ammonia-lyase